MAKSKKRKVMRHTEQRDLLDECQAYQLIATRQVQGPSKYAPHTRERWTAEPSLYFTANFKAKLSIVHAKNPRLASLKFVKEHADVLRQAVVMCKLRGVTRQRKDHGWPEFR